MVKLALLWHMHQPYYEDRATGEHILPWARLHATKDYWGMVAILDEFPAVGVTFNLAPSLLVQVEAFAEERAKDHHLVIGLKPADLLSDEERRFLVANGFHAPVDRAIRPNTRYNELFGMRSRPEAFTTRDLLDLQVWHKLVWMDPDWLARDPRLGALVAKGHDFTEEDKHQLRRVEVELLRGVLPAYRRAAESGRIELTTSPFYHPILPLLCDSDVHFRAHPHSALPRGLFSYPDDAGEQLARALEHHRRTFGVSPAGVWPSEGSVSDEVVRLLAQQGVTWTATDEELLSRTLGRRVTADDLYRPYLVGGPAGVRMLFRDHHLSDLIGFTYQSWGEEAAAADFLAKVRDAGRRFSDAGGREDPTVTVILDGENAWEHYAGGGRPFLRTLYRVLGEADDVEMVTMSDAASGPARELPSVFPGSWINGDFYIWAGHHDDHQAWQQLAAARRVFDEHKDRVTPEARAEAREELLIAEGSDWFWWYGDDHSSDHDREFDDLFRRHVRNVYRALGQPEPDDLHVSNISTEAHPAGPLTIGALSSPAIDGRSTDYSQWMHAASVPLGGGGGTMHRVAGQLVRALRVAADQESLYIRVDGPELVRRVSSGELRLAILEDRPTRRRVQPVWVVDDIGTARVPFSDLAARPGDRVSLSLVVTDDRGQVIEQHPARYPIELTRPLVAHDAYRWLV
jgi:alpha-amylase/alpha-mannosidase (GH57 family)